MKKTLKASFTIEAAVIMPIIIAMIWMLLYWGFFLYNESFVHTKTTHRVYEEAYNWKENTKKEIKKEHLLSVDSFTMESKKQGKKIGATTRYKMKVPIQNFIQAFFPFSAKEILYQKETEKIEPISFIRNCRKIEAALPKKEEPNVTGRIQKGNS